MKPEISNLKLKMVQVFGMPSLDRKRVLEAMIGPVYYIGSFYFFSRLLNNYLSSSHFLDMRMALILSVLAITRAVFEDSLVSALAGLTSVTLMFNILRQIGCLNQFGVIQTSINGVIVRIEFTNLLIIILILIILKTLLYTFETIKNLTKVTEKLTSLCYDYP